MDRPSVRGKFLYAGERKLYIGGVTYGTFRPDEEGLQFRARALVERDFQCMAAAGINAVRTYTTPPIWLLDVALQCGLHVMVGTPWEQHVTFLDDKARARSIDRRVRSAVKSCSRHPAVLCYTIGNEIPSSIVRWHGPARIERFLYRLYEGAKAVDPEAPITYVNFPTTEYLELPFLDLVSFNVYLESQERLQAYLGRLQNLAGDRPLILTEIGLDSRRHGEEGQAQSVDWQLRTAFASGCAGAFVFSWTDEWHRGGYDIEDWDFGLTRRDGSPKEALAAVRRAFTQAPFPSEADWPRISVVVCSYNGHGTIRGCFEGLSRLQYPNFEVIVVDDGSSEPLTSLAEQHAFRLIRTENQGLSAARNIGWREATGEIVAYIDDDAYPDPQWLTYLADTFRHTNHAGVGGPNIEPPGDGRIAECVSNAPGNPAHVLVSDHEAEHIPGCNMAFRRSALEAIGGFDPQFRVAGDDVDVSWRIQQRGWTLGFHAGAMVWHHRRNSIGAYWRQQKGYGRAEALLERKWPEKYNGAGHLSWTGRVYGRGLSLPRRSRIYHGVWGCAPFQRLYQAAPNSLFSLLLIPEWYLVILVLGGLAILGRHWARLYLTLNLFILAAVTPLIQAWRSAMGAKFNPTPRFRAERWWLQGLTMFLHLAQPLARLCGRLQHGLFPWRRPSPHGFHLPRPQSLEIWSETSVAADQRLRVFEECLGAEGAFVVRGGTYDRWDLEVWGGMMGAGRLRMAIEEHGGGRQLVRVRCWPHCARAAMLVASLLVALGVGAALEQALAASAALAAVSILLVLRAVQECGTAMSAVIQAVHAQTAKDTVHKPVQREVSRVVGGSESGTSVTGATARSGASL